MKAFVRLSLAGTAWVAGAFLLAACPSQGEGERCAKENGSNDCEPGLVCPSDICCKPGSSACNPPTTSTAGSGGTPATDGAPQTSPDADATAANETAASEASTTTSDADASSAPSADAPDGAAE